MCKNGAATCHQALFDAQRPGKALNGRREIVLTIVNSVKRFRNFTATLAERQTETYINAIVADTDN
jgi:hypothetical protein